MRGTIRKIPLSRRLVADLMHASMPTCPLFRCAAPLTSGLCWRRGRWRSSRPGWAAIFVKAFGMVAKRSTGAAHAVRQMALAAFLRIAALRRDGGDCAGRGRRGLRAAAEDAPAPDREPLAEIDAPDPACQDRADRADPAFRKMLRALGAAAAASPPGLADRSQFRPPARQLFRQLRGDVGRRLSAVANFTRSALGHSCSATTWCSPDQTIDVVIRWDHRITDAALIAKAMTRLEQVLNTEIAAELRGRRLWQAEPKPFRAVAT